MSNCVMVYTTLPTREQARRFGEDLIEKGYAACVNFIPGMISIYKWQDSLTRDEEYAVFIKTTRNKVQNLLAEAKRIHPHDVPALVVIPIESGDPEYLQWINQQVGE